ncbi:MAG: TauD/TfdA family dioxygenase, partial [Pseudomonadota bacterium]|nr:TauD/TfdA family dioxygenase [Pseudomonadota bacterium]
MAENIEITGAPRAVDEPSVWSTADLAADRSWEYHLSAGHRAELDAAVTAVTGADGTVRPGFTRDDFVLPTLAATLDDIYRQLKDGRGFAVLRGLDISDRGQDRMAALLWGLG